MKLNDILKSENVLEREYNDLETAIFFDRFLSRLDAVKRYKIARKYCFGTVLDAACGSGYGSYILSKCPSVDKVIGIDIDKDIIDFAKSEFIDDKIDFKCFDFSKELLPKADTIVSLETIEHMTAEDGKMFIDNIYNSRAKRLIISFPSFKTTTFNKYHLKDYTKVEMTDLIGRAPVMSTIIDDGVYFLVYDL